MEWEWEWVGAELDWESGKAWGIKGLFCTFTLSSAPIVLSLCSVRVCFCRCYMPVDGEAV